MGAVVGESVTTPGKQVVYYILRCELCILTHIYPLPSEDALSAYYARCFYAGPASQEVTQHERDREWYETCCYGPVLTQCQDILATQGITHIPKVLDIGAGSGVLLDTAQKHGMQTMGIEPDSVRCNDLAMKDHLVCAGTLQAHKRCVEKWQPGICILWETLEHVSCPESLLLDVYDLMKPGALLVISVPNDWSPLQLAACAKYGIEPWWIIPPIHTHYFTPKTAQLLVRRCGFSIRDLRGTYPLEETMVRPFGQCYIGQEWLWRAYTDEKIRDEMQSMKEGRWHEVEAQYRANIAERIGRSILLIAQKV